MATFVRLDTRRFNAQARAFLAGAMPETVDKVIRWGAFAVVGELVRSLNGEEAGYDVPKRIDTGRYRAAWSVTTREVFGRAAGPVSGGQGGDGRGNLVGAALDRKVMLTNNVEYGHHVEWGTRSMRPGRHARRALVVTGPKYRRAAIRIVTDALSGRRS